MEAGLGMDVVVVAEIQPIMTIHTEIGDFLVVKVQLERLILENLLRGMMAMVGLMCLSVADVEAVLAIVKLVKGKIEGLEGHLSAIVELGKGKYLPLPNLSFFYVAKLFFKTVLIR